MIRLSPDAIDKARQSLGINNDLKSMQNYVQTEYAAAMAYQAYCRESFAPAWNKYSFSNNCLKERQRHLNALSRSRFPLSSGTN